MPPQGPASLACTLPVPPMDQSRGCGVEVASVRRELRADAEQVTQVLRGEPVTVVETRDGWARVETAYGYRGWVREDELGDELDEEWLPPRRAGDVLSEARAYMGAPYEWGGMTERGIDCSGLVHMAFRRLGVLVPRDSWQQEEAGEEVAEAELRPGDLVCYDGHIAFWLGQGRILHASGRAGVQRVLEEPEPPELASRRRGYRRLRLSDG
jgi:gamma-D-glutamyl-L-lysine dipeptidyl-peptidase